MKIQTNTDFINEVGLTIPNTSKDILIMIEYLSIKTHCVIFCTTLRKHYP